MHLLSKDVESSVYVV